MRSLVEGIGVNDAPYTTYPRIGGKQTICQFYRTWHSMLERAYSPTTHIRQPAYIGVTVCDEWRSFMNFRSWMMFQDWRGKQLDKDIIVPGNRVYGPDACCFVGRRVNLLLGDCRAARGKYPVGVYWHKAREKFLSQCRDGTGTQKHLGYFGTPEEASIAYCEFKARVIREIAGAQTDRRIAAGLELHATKYDFERIALTGKQGPARTTPGARLPDVKPPCRLPRLHCGVGDFF